MITDHADRGEAAVSWVPTVVPAATAMVGALAGAGLGGFLQRKRDYTLARRAQLARVYQDLLELVLMRTERVVQIHSEGRDPDLEPEPEEIGDKAQSVAERLALWAPDGLIRDFTKWMQDTREHAWDDSPDKVMEIGSLGAVLTRMRRDMGHKNEGLPDHELLRLIFDAKRPGPKSII